MSEAAADRIRVAVVDDHEMFRAGVIATLRDSFDIVGQASAVRQNQLATFGAHHRINRQRGGHGCVWVPDMALVKGKIVRCHNRLVNQDRKSVV